MGCRREISQGVGLQRAEIAKGIYMKMGFGREQSLGCWRVASLCDGFQAMVSIATQLQGNTMNGARPGGSCKGECE
jgi:hypothetical protein